MNTRKIAAGVIALVFAVAAAPLFAQPAQSPGLDVVGFGYDVFGRYADMASKKPHRLFELTGARIEPIGTDRFEVPDGILLEPIVDHRISTVEGSSIREYARSLSVNAGLSVNAFLFRGSVETNIATSDSGRVQRYYYTYMDSNTMWRVSLDTVNMDRLRARLRPQVRVDIDSLAPRDLFDAYGTHYIATAYLGGRADYTSISEITDSVSASSIRVAVEAEYRAISGSTEVTSQQRETLSNSNTRTELRVIGGNARYVSDIRNPDQYERWADGIETRPVLCDFDTTSLRPIWELASSPGRRQQLEQAFGALIAEFPLPLEFANLAALSSELYMVESKTDGRFWDIDGYHLAAGTKDAALGLYRSDRVTQSYEGADRFIRVIPHPVDDDFVFLQPQHSEFVVTIENGSTEANAGLVLDRMVPAHRRGQFKLDPVPDEPDTYFLTSRLSEMVLQPDVAAGRVVQVPFTGGDEQKWVFRQIDPAVYMAPPSRGYYSVQATAGRKYWDFPGSYPTVRGGELQVWSGQPTQWAADRWVEVIPIDGPWNLLRPRHLPNHVLAASSRGRVTATGRTSENAQLWKFEYAGAPNTWYIRNRATDEVMDLNGNRVNVNGGEVSTWSFHGGDNQRWVVTVAGELAPVLHEGTFRIRSASTNHYIDLSGNATASNVNGANVQLWSLNGGEAQATDRIVRFAPWSSDGGFVIIFQNGGRVLEVSSSRDENGQNVQAWERRNTTNQRWRVNAQGNKETFVLTTLMSSGRALDVEGNGDGLSTNGTNVIISDRHNRVSQQFVFVHADGPRAGQNFVVE